MPRNTWLDALGGGRRVAVGPVEARRGVLPGRAQPGDDPPDHLVERRVARDLVAQPALEDPGSLLAHRLFFVAQQVGPLERPEIGELGPVDQAIDQLVSLLRVAIGQERPGLVGLGKPADRVEIGPPQEDRIAADGEGLIRRALSLAKTSSSIGPLAGKPRQTKPGRSAQEGQPAGRAAVHVADARRPSRSRSVRVTRPSDETSTRVGSLTS